MFPRIMTVRRKDKTYQYLVITESVRAKGKGSTPRTVANLGNIEKFSRQDVANIIDGLIRIFKLDQFAVSKDVEILESLEHGSILLWRKLWDDLQLTRIIEHAIARKQKRIALEAHKYAEMMVVNRCVDPLSKLGATRWVDCTCYKVMKGYEDLSLDVNNFYRSMDYLLLVKDEVELALFNRLRNLFSINVRLTFYDITSTYFYSDSCPLSENGYSRDDRPDLEQIVIGVVTSYEGYPIKHFVFEGNTKDETTVAEVVRELKSTFRIEETTFVGDRGMITKLNLTRIEGEGFDYIMGVKHRQDEICQWLFSRDLCLNSWELHNGLKIAERRISIREFLIGKTTQLLRLNEIEPPSDALALFETMIQVLTNDQPPMYSSYKPVLEKLTGSDNEKLRQRIWRLIKKYAGRYGDNLRYVLCLNEERKEISKLKRNEILEELSLQLHRCRPTQDQDAVEIERALSKIFHGYKAKFRKFFEIDTCPQSDKPIKYRRNASALAREQKLDGVFTLLTTREDLPIAKVVDCYKNLKEVESLFHDLKHFVDIRPIRHWLSHRVRAHVFLCILALLLKRIFEIDRLGGKSTMHPIEELSKSKLVHYRVSFSQRDARTETFPKVSNTSPLQKKYFNLLGIKNPMSLEPYV